MSRPANCSSATADCVENNEWEESEADERELLLNFVLFAVNRGFDDD